MDAELTAPVGLEAQEREARPLVIYFHGGGWVIGDVEIVDKPWRRRTTG
jgi:acetyl esterase/lipase